MDLEDVGGRPVMALQTNGISSVHEVNLFGGSIPDIDRFGSSPVHNSNKIVARSKP